jgi:acylaminoacyl-peptidase
MDVDKNKYRAHIHVVDTAVATGAASADAGEPSVRQLTQGEDSVAKPRWSPDGTRLAFTSERENKTEQIFVLPLTDGGEAERVSDLPPGSIGQIAWSPDGTRIAFAFRADDPEFDREAEEEREKADRSPPPREITRLRYRYEGAGFLPRARFHLHILDLAVRHVTQITHDKDRDHEAFCWSPDGTRLAFVRNTAPDPDLLPNARDLFVIPAEGLGDGEEPARLPCPPGPKIAPAWSPDGAYIAYLGHDKAEEVWGITNLHPWVVPTQGNGSARDLAPDWDVCCGNETVGDLTSGGESGPHWAADSRSLLLLASIRGAVDVFRVFVEDNAGAPRRVTSGTHAVTGFTTAAAVAAPSSAAVASSSQQADVCALLVATPSDAGDIYVLPPGREFFRRLTRLNQALLDEIDLAGPKQSEAPSPSGHTVPFWALLPPDFADKPGPRPAIVYVHGGPHLMYAHTLFWEYQTLAARGYVVLYPNPRGSQGYGEAWTGAIKGNWGEPAHEDVLACVDHAIAQGWADPTHLGIAGGSYGGYLSAWVVGHTDRFRAAVAERGVYNLHSMAGTCDFVWIDRNYFDANTWDDPAAYLRNSPLTYAGQITTPLLILHSEGDLRCPIGQAEELFAALKRQSKEAVFVRYGPQANHELSRGGPPDLRLDRLRRIQDWFDRHLKPKSEQDAN